MSTLCWALIAIVISIVNSQSYEDCGSETITVGGSSLTIQLERDVTNSEVRITLTGPNNKWFGFVIGQGLMTGGYGISGEGSTYELVERVLAKQQGGGTILTSSGTQTATLGSTNGVVTLVRPYTASSSSYYDFTDLLTCNTNTMPFAGAIGSSLTFKIHTSVLESQTFTRTCSCPTSDPTGAPSKQPTQPTTAMPTAAPTTAIPTGDPTKDPTNDPTEDPTADPSMDPTNDPTRNPTQVGQTSDPTSNPTTTSAPTTGDPTVTPITSEPTSIPSASPIEGDGYEQCATAELITGVKLNIERNTDDQMIRIVISGPSTGWLGYGFGSAVMTDAYGVTVEGDDLTSMGIRERTLDSDSAPGTLLTTTGSTQVIVSDDDSMEATFERAYASTNGGFDFTDFMTCSIDSIDIIAAQGSQTKMNYHSTTKAGETLTRLNTCKCGTSSPTSNPTSSPTDMEPGDGGSANNIFNVFNIMAIVFISVYAMT